MDRLTIQQLDRIEAKLNTLMLIEGIELDEHGFPIIDNIQIETTENDKEEIKEEEKPKKKIQAKGDEEWQKKKKT